MKDETISRPIPRLARQSTVEYIDHMGDDLSVERAARVSFAGDGTVRPIEKTERLLNYLARHNHWTPFGHTSVTLRIQAPIPIRTQCFKHKVGFVENEESRRYVSYTPSVFQPEWRKSTENKKQGSGEEFDAADSVMLNGLYLNAVTQAVETYEVLLTLGVCEEQARFVLPQGVMVNWYWTGSLAAWARVYHQRSDTHAQKEIQHIAEQIDHIIAPLYPLAWKALTGKE